MQLDDIAARLRPRNAYEATDLGIVLARRFWKPMVVAWLACVVPIVAGAAIVSAMTPLFWAPLAVVWLLKPLYDRVPLFVISRAFFGDVPDLKRSVGYTMGAWRTLGAAADITWRRFNPYRAAALPVRELEQLGGSSARARLKTLFRRDVKTPATWLLCVSAAVEVLLVVAAVALVSMVTPETVGLDVLGHLDGLLMNPTNAPMVETALFVVYLGALTVVECMYVAASFGLYINRRVRLEGWDIEIVFKRLARKLSAQAAGPGQPSPDHPSPDQPASDQPGPNQPGPNRSAASAANAGLVVLALLGALASPQPLIAQPSPVGAAPATEAGQPAQNLADQPAESDIDPQTAISDILDAPEFGRQTTEKQWRLRQDLVEPDDEEPTDLGWVEQLAIQAAELLQVALWIVAGAVVIAGAYYVFKTVRRPSTDSPSSAADVSATIVHAGPKEVTTAVTLPHNIVAAAVDAWHAGARVRSLSLLYRGTIEGLADGYRIDIDPNMTARECAEHVRQAGGPADYVAMLGQAWSSAAYAGRPITGDAAQDLFAQWKAHFRPDAPRGRGGRG